MERRSNPTNLSNPQWEFGRAIYPNIQVVVILENGICIGGSMPLLTGLIADAHDTCCLKIFQLGQVLILYSIYGKGRGVVYSSNKPRINLSAGKPAKGFSRV